MKFRTVSLLGPLLLLSLGGCNDDTTFVPTPGAGGPLDPTITEPPLGGSASGSEFEGNWNVELYWSDCSGTCAVDTVLGVASVCDIGQTDRDNAQITQIDGLLQIDLNGQELRFNGGVNDDGTYDLLGVATQFGGAVEIRVRAQGTLNGLEITGSSRSLTVGTVEGQSVNCWGTIEVTGSRDTG